MILIIDAMDYFMVQDGFCIVSSDSDFTPSFRIRESGLIVYGFMKNS
jgi:uncharacterized LabA/DUF88 family protein